MSTSKSIFIFSLIIHITTACCKKESKEDRIANNLETGNWKITKLTDQGNDYTSSFVGYNLDFGSEGVLNITNATEAYYGTWSLNYDESNANNQTLQLNVQQSPTNEFDKINRNWKFIGQTSSKIKLKNENAITDYLTLGKEE